MHFLVSHSTPQPLPWHAEVFWPVPADPPARLNDPSDHHLVRVDVFVPLR